MRQLLASVVALAAAMGCAPQPRPNAAGSELQTSAENPKATLPESDVPNSPLVARWALATVVSASEIHLVAHVETLTALSMPVHVQVIVPAGVSVVSGPTTFDVPASGKPAIVEQAYVFKVSPTSVGEVVVAAHAVSTGFGAHAKDAYPVGAAAKAREATPEAIGPRLKIGDRDFGPSVPLTR